MTGSEIKALRKRLRLTQRKFARVLGAHVITVSRWERGEVRPDGVTLRLLRVLDKRSRSLSQTRDWGKIIKTVGKAVAVASVAASTIFLMVLLGGKGFKR